MAASSSNPLRVAVLGTGSLGQHHARIYAEMAAAGDVEFAGLFDAVPETARSFAQKFGTRAFTSVEEAAAHSDALNVVTPTTTHHALARQLLAQGKHLLVEKPITNDVASARELVELAGQHGCRLQVGHIERFNPVFPLLAAAGAPRHIEAQRLSPHPGRSADVGVTLDLMIHDLDLVLALVRSPLVSVEASGAALLSPSEDIARARLRFQDGCVADLTASRVSEERRRTMQVFLGGADSRGLSVDFRTQEAWQLRVGPEGELSSGAVVVSQFGGRQLRREPLAVTKDEPLKLELRDFIACIREQRPPRADGTAGVRALELALEITRQIRQAH